MGRVILLTSLVVCILSLAFKLNLLTPFYYKLGQFVPDCMKDAVSRMPVFSGWFPHPSRSERLMTQEELSKYTGEDGTDVYLSILGHIYDVTRGRKHYGPGGGYSFFAGRDASRAFVTGDFENGLTDDLSELTNDNILSLEDWKKFYDKDYIYIGKLIGTFYTAEGKATKVMEEYQNSLLRALDDKKRQEDIDRQFPPCNSEWSQGGHTRVWCSNLSGGIQRSWVGVPRQFNQPGMPNSRPRCVCVRNIGPPSNEMNSMLHTNNGDLDNPNLKPYPLCDTQADSCVIINT